MHNLAISGTIGILAFILGMAIHRGSTCAVGAVGELIYRRRADMFIGFFECGLWALLIVGLVASTTMVPDWAPVLWLCVGSAIFGIGAAINDGCAFGSIARLGTGRIDYLLTGVGVWLAYYLFDLFDMIGLPKATNSSDRVSLWIVFIGLPALILLRWWLRPRPLRMILRLSFVMAIIGICGSLLTILDQPWPWMRALQLIDNANLISIISFVMLLAGSVYSGLSNGRFRLKIPRLPDMGSRLFGGILMGSGSAIVPGGNDSFILHGLSSGNGIAILGYVTMLISIAITLILTRRLMAG